MGQINSSNIQSLLPNIYSELFNKEPNALIAKEIKEMDREKFQEIISELNSFSRDYFDNEGKQMIFAVRQGSDQCILWKAVVEIACIKIDPDSSEVKNYRTLSLVELMKIFYSLKYQNAAKDQSEKACITYEKIVSHADNDPVMSSECTICLERKVELTLPCAHSFCSQCIEEWSSEHHTCPICRDKLESTSDSWVLSEKPEADEISQELRSNLIRLTEEKKDSCTAS
ncbi:RING finger protein 141-like isoform X1 [Coccinella septempunctata]|uniref:RING finger protein 141-like isoform X1 n=1 Tax=Coccinella septempunctata TaxID=41139 RepID=UPI001D06F0AE|nr:RING finger protein 141-like isoform X1 [Coccinella septempunctata]